MDLGRLEGERRPGQDLGPVQRLAVGRRPQAGLLAAGGQVGAAQRVQEGLVGRDHLVADDRQDPLAILVIGHPCDLDDDRRLGRRLEQSLELGDRPLGHDPGGGQAARDPFPEQLDVGGHERRVGPQTGDEPLEALGRVGGLEGGDRRQEGLRTAHLVDRPEEVDPLVVLLDLELAHDPDHVQGDPILEGLVGSVDPEGRCEGRLDQRPGAQSAGCAGILEAIVVALVAVHRGGRRILLEDRFPEPVGELVDGAGRVEPVHQCLHGAAAGAISVVDPERLAIWAFAPSLSRRTGWSARSPGAPPGDRGRGMARGRQASAARVRRRPAGGWP